MLVFLVQIAPSLAIYYNLVIVDQQQAAQKKYPIYIPSVSLEYFIKHLINI